MAKFEIVKPELHWATVEVEASTIEEAFEKALAGDEECETACEFGRTLEPSEFLWEGRPKDGEMPTHSWNGTEVKPL
jgi:hypothetical protein